MTGGEFDDELSVADGERVFHDNQRVRTQRLCHCKRTWEIFRASHLQGVNLNPQRLARSLRLIEDKRGVRISRVPNHGHARYTGEELP